jgi:multidrug efflux pump
MVVSLTTTPMMCAFLLRDTRAQSHGRLYMASERFFDGVLSLYRRTLHWVLGRPALTLSVLVVTIVLNVVVIIKIPKGFFPPEDTGRSRAPSRDRRMRPSRRWTTRSGRSAR